ncbi:MAG: ABC transporter ATP-binding protein [Oscillospiraceae bacterium]|jgi:iron complex transport system ATP-binding protein|nr:ABC transporter ATP-binding protein [Oscillospiraceae bacterium]
MLKVENVSAGYGGATVVRGVSFSLDKNESICIIGPNGCGKTTLLRAVAGLLPYSGSVELDGKPLRKMKLREIAKKIAMLSQISGIYFSYSVFETVMMGRYLHMRDSFFGAPSERDRELVFECLRAVDLTDAAGKEISALSGGQLQRVFFARALAQEPEVILLDEPTNHLDIKYQIELIEYLKEWSRAGGHRAVGVLHDINLAMRLSENMLIMKDGAVAAEGRAGEKIDSAMLRDVYGVDVVDFMRRSLRRWDGMK